MKYDMEIAVSLPYPFLVVTPVGRSSREATVGSWERNEGKKSDEGTETEWEWRAKWGPGHSSSLPTPFRSSVSESVALYVHYPPPHVGTTDREWDRGDEGPDRQGVKEVRRENESPY